MICINHKVIFGTNLGYNVDCEVGQGAWNTTFLHDEEEAAVRVSWKSSTAGALSLSLRAGTFKGQPTRLRPFVLF